MMLQKSKSGESKATTGASSAKGGGSSVSGGAVPIPSGVAKRGRRATGRGRGGRGGSGLISAPAPTSKSDFVFDVESSEEEPDLQQLAVTQEASDDVLWKVGVDQFHRDFRHQVCERFVQQKVNSAAAAMVGAILRKHMPMERGVAEGRTINVSIHDFKVHLPNTVAIDEREKMAKMYMDHLKNDQVSRSQWMS